MSEQNHNPRKTEAMRPTVSLENRDSSSCGKLGKCINLFAGKDRGATVPRILPEDQFRSALNRERHRADRNGHGFSVVGFDLKGARNGSADRFVRNLVTSCRATDEVGWFEESIVGILLFNTPEPEARCFAQGAARVALELNMSLDYGVWAYPSHWGRDDDDEGPSGGGPGEEEASGERDRPSEKWSGTLRAFRDGEVPPEKGRVRQAVRSLLFAESLPLWKRVMDIAGSALGLLLLLPLFVFVALLIKTVSPGPIFFRQKRVGFNGKRFTLWKFRTMHVNNDTSRHQAALAEMIHAGDGACARRMTKLDSNCSDIIRFGHILRKCSIDELPQLLNVLFGDMSLVGPRPPIPYEAEEYLRWHNGRFDAVPGMTGLWQVSGKNSLTFNEMARLDIQYARHMSFWLDVEILVRTPLVVLSQAIGGSEQAAAAAATPSEQAAV